MKLIKYENFEITVSEEAFLIGAVRRMFNKDRTVNKDVFFKQMCVMYFVYDPRSNFAYIIDEDTRLTEVLTQEGLTKDEWNKKYNTDDFKEAKEIYLKANVTSAQKLLDSARIGIDKVSKFLEEVDLTAEDDKGKPKYTVAQITSALKDVPKLADSITELEKAVIKEIEENGKARGNAEMSLFDNGINI